MTKNEFWTTLLKVFALFAIINYLFFHLIDDIWYLVVDRSIYSLISLIINAILPIFLFIAIFINTKNIIRFLRLDKDVESEKIEFGKLNAVDIVKISVFIIGGLLIIENIPSFLNNAFVAFSERDLGDGFLQPTSYSWAQSAINILIGCLLIMYKDSISRLFTKKRVDTDEDVID